MSHLARARLRHIDADAVVADYETGATVRSICEGHGIGLSTLYRILDDAHVARRQRDHAQRTPDDVQEAIAAAYQAGGTVREIAAAHGVSPTTVSNIGRRRFGQRVTVRTHDELVRLIVAWLCGDRLSETETDAINRIGVATRLPGLAAIGGVDPALRSSLLEALPAALNLMWSDDGLSHASGNVDAGEW